MDPVLHPHLADERPARLRGAGGEDVANGAGPGNAKVGGKVVQRATGYSGQGFSLRGEKDRFVLPSKLRNPLAEASGERVLCLSRHDRWPCLVGFGNDRVATFEDVLDSEEEKALRLGRDFDRELRAASLWTFTPTNFDASGRFVLSATLSELGQIDKAIYFHGIGQVITLWNPDILLAQGSDFAQLQAYCRQEMGGGK